MQRTYALYGAVAIGAAAAAVATPLLVRELDAVWPSAQTAPASIARDEAASQAGAPAPRRLSEGSVAAKADAAKRTTAESAPDAERPGFDVVRVDPTGEAVVAGHAAPKAALQLRDEGRVIAEVDADASGQFVVLPPTLAAGSHRLELAARGDGGPLVSEPLTIEVAAQKTDAAGNSPAPLLAAPAAAPPPKTSIPPPAPVAGVRVAPVSIAPAPAAGVTAQKPGPSSEPPPAPAMAALSPTPKPSAPAPALSGAETVRVPPAPVAAAGVASGLSVRTVEASQAGRLEVKGVAEPNSRLRLYLNGSHLADVSAGSDQRWSLTIEHGMSPGFYTFRAEVIGGPNGAVKTRAEVPFSYPLNPSATGAPLASSPPPADAAAAKPQAPAGAPSKALAGVAAPLQPFAPPKAPPGVIQALPIPSASASIASPPANAVISDVQTATVAPGDNLWDLARRFYGDGTRFRQIYEANASQIRVPSLIYIGQQLVVPKQPPP